MAKGPDGYAKFFKQAQAVARGESESPEARLKQELERRAKLRGAKTRVKRAKFPMHSAVVVVVGLVAAGAAVTRPDLAERAYDATVGLFGHIEISPIGAASASAPPAANAAKDEAKPAATNAGPPATSAPSADAAATADAGPPRSLTPEEINVFSKLSERKKQLDLREAELSKLEEELQKQKAELDKKLQQLETTRREIASTLKTRVEADGEKVDKLVQMYSNMKPQQAAKVIETLNEDLAVGVLDKMKKKNAADVLNVMDPKKARKLSEILAGYKRAE